MFVYIQKRIITLPSNKHINLGFNVILRDPLQRPAIDAILKMYISISLKWLTQDSLVDPFLSLQLS